MLPPVTMKETKTPLTAKKTLMVRKTRRKRMLGLTLVPKRKKASRQSRHRRKRRRIQKRKFSTV